MNKFQLHSKQEGRNASIIAKRLKRIIIITIIFCIIFNSFTNVEVSFADTTTQVGVRVDYLDDLVYITSGTGGSTKFYMSTDNKTWDIIETNGVVDISAILTMKETIVRFKGNKDGKATEVKLPAEDSNLKVTYRIVDGDGKIELSSLPVEYRKGINGTWKTALNLTPTSIYELKGATLFFRFPATVLKRAGKTTTLKISKRPTAPSVKLDGSKLNISGMKIGETQYRVGESTGWITCTLLNAPLKAIDLFNLLNPVGTTANTPIPAGIIEFRTLGSGKKLTSAIKVVEVALQPTVPDLVSVTGTALTIRDTDLKRAYEYTKVEKTASLNMLTAKWTTVTSKNTVKMKVAVGDKILVRLKSITDSKTKQVIPASTYKEIVITNI